MAETLLLAATAAQGVGAAGAATGLATAGGAIGGFMASGVGSLLTTGLTAASAFGSFQQGRMSAAVAKSQAAQSALAARQEELRGREEADRIRRSLQATLASQNAMFGARGIVPGVGSPRVLEQVSTQEASRDIDLARFGAGQRSSALQSEAAQYKLQGKAAAMKGVGEATTRLVSLL